MSNFAAVLDACVIIPAVVRDTLLRAAEAGLYRPRWSHDILDEVERNLTRIIGTRGHADAEGKVQHLLAELRAQFPEAIVTGYGALIPTMTNHEKDRHVLAAAVTSDAQAIITSNSIHFPASALGPYNIEALTPDQFLSDLFDLYPEQMCAILLAQAAALHRPQTADDLLTNLNRSAPNFVKSVRQYLAQNLPC